MQNSFISPKWVVFLVFTLLFNSGFLYANENEGLLLKKVKLYSAKKEGKKINPYTVFYPINVTAPGRVLFDIQVTSYTSKQIGKEKAPFRWVFVDSRFLNGKTKMNQNQFKKWLKKASKYHPVEYLAGDQIRSVTRAFKSTINGLIGKKKKRKANPEYFHRGSAHIALADSRSVHPMHYDIDQLDLAKSGGMYFLIVQNYSRRLTPEFKINVSFPGSQYHVDDELMPKRDLGVRRIRLSGDRVLVSVANNGEGRITDDIYKRKGKKAFTLMLKINGKSWGGVSLKGLDPEKKLAKPGGRVGYVFDKVKITKPTEITATLKMPNFRDANRKNNTKTVTLNVKK